MQSVNHVKRSSGIKRMLACSTLVLSALTLSALTFNASAATVSLMPSSQSVAVGANFSVDILVSDLATDALGGWDGSLLFDSQYVTLVSTALGDDVLGNQLDLAALGTYNEISALSNGVNLLEVSYDDPAQLLSQQADSFVLATLTFTRLADGTLDFSFLANDFSDASGDASLLLESNLASAQISAVPVPAAAWLLLSGIGALATMARRKRSNG